MSATVPRRRGVIVSVGGPVVVLPFLHLAPLPVRVDERRVVVLVLVIVGPMLELAERSVRMVMGDVVVIVGVDDTVVGMLIAHVPDDPLQRAGLRQGAPPCSKVNRRPDQGLVR